MFSNHKILTSWLHATDYLYILYLSLDQMIKVGFMKSFQGEMLL
jgi:hypothetical protein